MKRFQPWGLFLASFVLLEVTSLTAIARADDDRDVTPEERVKIEQVLTSLGCNSSDDIDFEINNKLYKISDANCQDGKEYDIYLDENYQVKFKRQDDD